MKIMGQKSISQVLVWYKLFYFKKNGFHKDKFFIFLVGSFFLKCFLFISKICLPEF